MNWLSALAALANVLAAILDMARDAQLRDAGRADALAEASTHAIDLIRNARDARRAAADAASDPSRLRDDDGFRRDCCGCLFGLRADPMVGQRAPTRQSSK